MPKEVFKNKDDQETATWIWRFDTLRCSNCGFGYFPTDYFFKYGKRISASMNRFIFKYCPECGREMEV